MHSQANESVGPESRWQKVRENRFRWHSTTTGSLHLRDRARATLPVARGGLPEDLATQRIGAFSVAPFLPSKLPSKKKRKLTFRNLSQGQTASCLLPGGLTEEVAAETICICHPGTVRWDNRFLVRTTLLGSAIYSTCIFLQRLKYLCALE